MATSSKNTKKKSKNEKPTNNKGDQSVPEKPQKEKHEKRKSSPKRRKKSGCCGWCCSIFLGAILVSLSSAFIYQLLLVDGDFNAALGEISRKSAEGISTIQTRFPRSPDEAIEVSKELYTFISQKSSEFAEDIKDRVSRLIDPESVQSDTKGKKSAESAETEKTQENVQETAKEESKPHHDVKEDVPIQQPEKQVLQEEQHVEDTKPEPQREETKPEPVVEETKPEPVLEETKEANVEETKQEAVVQEIKKEDPVLEETKSEPVLEKKEEADVEVTETEPVVKETKEEQPVEEHKLEPVMEETKDKPHVEEEEPEPIVEETKNESSVEGKLEPIKEDTKDKPSVEGEKPEPHVEQNKPEPVVEDTKKEPLQEETNPDLLSEEPKEEPPQGETKLEPIVEETIEEPVVEAREESPVEETKPKSFVEETGVKNDPEIVVEETKEDPPVKERKTEPVMEETKPHPPVEEASPEPVVEEIKQESPVEETKAEPIVKDTKPESGTDGTKQELPNENKPEPETDEREAADDGYEDEEERDEEEDEDNEEYEEDEREPRESVKQEVKSSDTGKKGDEEVEGDKAERKEEKPEDPKLNYEHRALTNQADYQIREQLDEADKVLARRSSDALKMYEDILRKHSGSPRAQYGMAKALDKMSEEQYSNQLLEDSIKAYQKIFDLKDVPDDLMKLAGLRCADRQAFRGWGGRAVQTLSRLVMLLPNDLSLVNQLGVQNLISGRTTEAKLHFEKVLKIEPENGFAKAHLGFIAMTSDKDVNRAIKLLSEGIASGEPGTNDGRFYFQLGDAYIRAGQSDKAYEVFKEGAKKGHFLSKYQRSLYNVDTLTGRPWWTLEQTGVAQQLKEIAKHWKMIREEALSLLDPKKGLFKMEDENLSDRGEWRQLTLYQRGSQVTENCQRAPKTCALFEHFTAAKSCKRGQIKFSVMQPGVHVWPHCGPTNCRIRTHLGLVVPEGPKIRVAEETRTWKEGEFLAFDDSFEHEVWHEGTSFRLILIVDVWHPELTNYQRRTLLPI